MSGIAGILRFDARPVASSQIQSMLEQMAHRGPDGMASWHEGCVGLGHAMLHTTPESQLETQPLRVPELNLTLVMDGRLDNWLELRGELLAASAPIPGKSDADLALAAYIHWGEDCPKHLNGDFALAIWDGRSGRLFCARDRIGQKPFYYYHGRNLFAFASELNILLELPEVSLDRDKTYLAEHLAMQLCSRDLTLWADVKRLVAAHSLQVGPEVMKATEYWQPDYQRSLYYRRDEDYVEHYRELHDDTLRRMSRSHGSLACAVSGGLDSSAIFATASVLKQQGKLLAPDFVGYTMDFSGDTDADEIDYARALARHLACPVHEIAPSFYALPWYLERGRRRRETTCVPNGVMRNRLLAQANADGSRVMLTGHGGDEWLGFGEACYLEVLQQRDWRALMALWHADRKAWGRPRALYYLLRYGLSPGLPPGIKNILRPLHDQLTGVGVEGKWLRREQAERLRISSRQRQDYQPSGFRWSGQAIEWQLMHSAKSAMALEMAEQLAAEAGIESRNPYWSTPLVQFSISIPKRLLYCPFIDRPLHRRAMAERLPALILGRDDKAYFDVTYDVIMPEIVEWLSERLPCAEELGLEVGRVRQIVHAEQARPGSEESDALWVLFCALAAT